MRIIYYLEINLFAMVILGLLWKQVQVVEDQTAERKYFNGMLAGSFSLCISDLLAGLFRGMTFFGARTILWLSNMAYIVSMPIIAYCWLMYGMIQMRRPWFVRRTVRKALAIPMLALIALVVSTPLTQCMFYLDETNLYHRGAWIWTQQAVSMGYMLLPSIVALAGFRNSPEYVRRQRLLPIATFVIFPTIGSIGQILFYGMTSVQAGAVVGLLMVTLWLQNAQILTDALTGLNNRGYLNRYMENKLRRDTPNRFVSVLMIDVNQFKSINDTYGHLAGDEALIDVAEILKAACSDYDGEHFAARYGGDEFAIVCPSSSPEKTQRLLERLQEETERSNREKTRPFRLSMSIGCREGYCRDFESIDDLLNQADKAMYEAKAAYKKEQETD